LKNVTIEITRGVTCVETSLLRKVAVISTKGIGVCCVECYCDVHRFLTKLARKGIIVVVQFDK
jgi:hypothetical protein